MTIVTINTEIETAVRDWAATTVKTDLARTKRTDILRAAGWTSAHCISPKSEGSAASDESWTFLKATINSGFPKQAQAMMEMSAKAAGDKTVNGQPRAYWIPSERGDRRYQDPTETPRGYRGRGCIGQDWPRHSHSVSRNQGSRIAERCNQAHPESGGIRVLN